MTRRNRDADLLAHRLDRAKLRCVQTSGPGAALTAPVPASKRGADVTTLPADHPLLLVLDYHAETCQLGPRVCADCSLNRDRTPLTSIGVAIAEKQEIQPWIDRYSDTCVYCGQGAEHRDHLVPRTWTSDTTSPPNSPSAKRSDAGSSSSTTAEPRSSPSH